MLAPAVQQQAAHCSSQVIIAVTEEGGIRAEMQESGGHAGQATEEENDQREITEIARGR